MSIFSKEFDFIKILKLIIKNWFIISKYSGNYYFCKLEATFLKKSWNSKNISNNVFSLFLLLLNNI